MSTRARIFLAALVLVVVPAGILAGFFRARLMTTLTREFTTTRHAELLGFHERFLDRADENRRTLLDLAAAAADDNQLRLALVGGRDDLRPYLRDHAGRVARTTRLDVLQLMDADGRILSSAHYRNEFGQSDAGLLTALGDGPDLAVATPWSSRDLRRVEPASTPAREPIARTAFTVERDPRQTFLAVVGRVDFELGGQRFHWVGGWRPDLAAASARAAFATADTVFGQGGGLRPGEVTPASLAAWGDRAQAAWVARRVPAVADGRLTMGALVAGASLAPLQQQRRATDALIVGTLAAVMAGAFLLAAFLSWQLSRPLVTLARAAERVDLDHPDTDLATTRGDEVGKLARVLQAMVQRLRSSARRLAQAEHRATLGEVARQVNHDLRNGLTPVRNVLRHLGETAEREPDRLATVFQERRGTLDRSLAYLEDLAGRYARLAPDARRERCDLAALAREVAAAHESVVVVSEPDVPRVLADPLSLRRILDNLLRNAHEALPDGRGAVSVRVASHPDADLGARCMLSVSDDGLGMTPEVQARVLEDFFTTKAGGSGLGLSNVRRLVGDAGGQLQIDSAPGEGTTVSITFPGAEDES